MYANGLKNAKMEMEIELEMANGKMHRIEEYISSTPPASSSTIFQTNTSEVPVIFPRSTVFYGTENGRLLKDELIGIRFHKIQILRLGYKFTLTKILINDVESSMISETILKFSLVDVCVKYEILTLISKETDISIQSND